MSEVTETATATEDPWESGALGRSEEFMERASDEVRKQIDDSLELQAISIRLQKTLLNDLKFIAQYREMGYQPLIREVLTRFAAAEINAIARELQEEKQKREAAEALNAPPAKVRRA